MCVILVSPNGEAFDIDELDAAQFTNSDGVGVAWRGDNGLIQYRKFAEFNRSKWHQPQGACIIHFRLATSGGRSIDMAHPFPITRSAGVRRWGEAKRVLFHNGHLHGWENDANNVLSRKLKTTSGPWSDSRLLAYCAHRYGESKIKTMAEDWGQRIAVFDNNSIATYGTWDHSVGDSVLRSNTYHRTLFGLEAKTPPGLSAGWEWEGDAYGAYDYHSRASTQGTGYVKTGVYPPIGHRTPHKAYDRNTEPVTGTPSLTRECCSFSEMHNEHLCLKCNEVICPDCHSWGACLTHRTVRLYEEPKQEGYAG